MGGRRNRPRLPWWGKIAAKLLLSRAPIPPKAWQRLGVFRHGAMDSPRYAYRVFMAHWRRADSPPLRGATILELGPGNSIGSALIARALGARCILVDAGRFASEDITFYRELADLLRAKGHEPPDLAAATTIDEVLQSCEADYWTNGIESLRRIPPRSIDLAFSQAVLEHIRRDEFDETMQMLARAQKLSGVGSHRVDLKDHLGGSLNNLRFRSALWESRLFANSGFYTNRLSYSEIVMALSAHYTMVEVKPRSEWSDPPLDATRFAPEFRSRSMEDLRVSGFDAILREPRRPSAGGGTTLSARGPRGLR